MQKNAITDINKQILIEKSKFIAQNSTFFHNNINIEETLIYLRNILLSPAPLEQCQDYNDLMKEIKESRTRNIEELSYSYSIETLFKIINLIRAQNINLSDSKNSAKIEMLRLYVRPITDLTSGKMYYSNQHIIIFDTNRANEIIEEDKQYKKERRNF